MIKKIIKKIASFKCILVKGEKSNSYIHPFASIRGYKNITLSNGAKIREGTKISTSNGRLIMSSNSSIAPSCNIYIKSGKLTLGENSYLNNDCTIIVIGSLTIGDNVMVGPMCSILAGKHNYSKEDMNFIVQGDTEGEIVVEENVWIGANSIILSGVKIGKGSIVGAGSVVTKSIGENEIWAGNPAKFIKVVR